jgi:hypothetical protein
MATKLIVNSVIKDVIGRNVRIIADLRFGQIVYPAPIVGWNMQTKELILYNDSGQVYDRILEKFILDSPSRIILEEGLILKKGKLYITKGRKIIKLEDYEDVYAGKSCFVGRQQGELQLKLYYDHNGNVLNNERSYDLDKEVIKP